jgi:RimJ/RimL family protein N-acetyltransferase
MRSPGTIHLSTTRLDLRPVRPDDLDHFAPMDADPEVMRYIADGRPRTREQAAAGLDRLVGTWRDHGFGIFTATVRDTGAVIGWVGLAIPGFLPEVLPAVEIGWRLRREFWGHGYATEGARAVLRWAFQDRNLDRLISIRHVDNVASGRVMAKLGFTLERTTTVPETGRPVVVHELIRESVTTVT